MSDCIFLKSDLYNIKNIIDLVENKKDVNTVDSNGNTYLHWAVFRNLYDLAKLLLDCGANPNITDCESRHAFHWALSPYANPEIKIIKLLLDYGANIHVHNSVRKTPLFLAAEECYPDILELILKQYRLIDWSLHITYGGNHPLHWPSFNGRCDVVKLLLDYGADPNSINREQETPLHSACYGNRIEIAKLLIEYGANVNAKDRDGETPLQAITISKQNKNNKIPLAKLLIANGANFYI